MKPFRENLAVSQPLRNVRLVCSGTVMQVFDRHAAEREQAAFERGRQEGEKALSEQLMRQRGELLELQKGVFTSLSQALPNLIHEAETLLVELALEAAQKLVADMPISAETVEACVRQALAQAEESTEFQVFLQADDLALLERINSPLLLSDAGRNRIHFSSSSEVTRGGCLVQTRFGTVDGRRETKIRILREAMKL